MANWKKVLVSGSNIEVNQISGSTLNLGGLGGSANDVLIINGDGSVSTLNQSNLTGASQNFLIRGDADGGTNISFQANENVLLFTTASGHGFSFNATDDETQRYKNVLHYLCDNGFGYAALNRSMLGPLENEFSDYHQICFGYTIPVFLEVMVSSLALILAPRYSHYLHL